MVTELKVHTCDKLEIKHAAEMLMNTDIKIPNVQGSVNNYVAALFAQPV